MHRSQDNMCKKYLKEAAFLAVTRNLMTPTNQKQEIHFEYKSVSVYIINSFYKTNETVPIKQMKTSFGKIIHC